MSSTAPQSQTDRKALSEILIRWDMPTRQAAISEILSWRDAAVREARIEELERIIKAYDMSGAFFFTQDNNQKTTNLSDRIAELTAQKGSEKK